jgi:hypothetical protein
VLFFLTSLPCGLAPVLHVMLGTFLFISLQIRLLFSDLSGEVTLGNLKHVHPFAFDPPFHLCLSHVKDALMAIY